MKRSSTVGIPSGRVPARRLRYLHPPYRLRLVGARKQLHPDHGPVLFQIGRQVLKAHRIDASSALVGLYSCQCTSQVITLHNRFHGRPLGRPAFELGFRRAGFGLLGSGAQGFTRCSGAQVQLDLIILPHDPFEIAVLLATPTVQAFDGSLRLLCPLLTSALRVLTPCGAPSPIAGTAAQTSRGKTNHLPRAPAGFTAPVIDGRGLRGCLPARPAGSASLSGSCPSGRRFAPRFFQAPPRGGPRLREAYPCVSLILRHHQAG
jgi:hypothetical protein